MAPTKNLKDHPQEKTLCVSKRHQSLGGSCGYDLAQRQAMMGVKDMGQEDKNFFDNLRFSHLHKLKRTTG